MNYTPLIVAPFLAGVIIFGIFVLVQKLSKYLKEKKNLKEADMGKHVDVSPQTTQTIIDNLPKNPPGKPVISSVEEARRMQALVAFKHDVDDLHNRIRLRINQLDNDKTPELQEVNCYLADKLEAILNMPINDKQSLDYAEWLFNYGELRTEDEINEREKAESDAEYIQSGRYETDCFSNKLGWGGGSFALGFILVILGNPDFKNPALLLVVGIPCGCFLGLVFMLIGFAIASKLNINNAESHNVPKNHPRYQHDRRELGLAGVSGVIAAGTIARKAHKTAKDIGNVDGWREMK